MLTPAAEKGGFYYGCTSEFPFRVQWLQPAGRGSLSGIHQHKASGSDQFADRRDGGPAPAAGRASGAGCANRGTGSPACRHDRGTGRSARPDRADAGR